MISRRLPPRGCVHSVGCTRQPESLSESGLLAQTLCFASAAGFWGQGLGLLLGRPPATRGLALVLFCRVHTCSESTQICSVLANLTFQIPRKNKPSFDTCMSSCKQNSAGLRSSVEDVRAPDSHYTRSQRLGLGLPAAQRSSRLTRITAHLSTWTTLNQQESVACVAPSASRVSENTFMRDSPEAETL